MTRKADFVIISAVQLSKRVWSGSILFSFFFFIAVDRTLKEVESLLLELSTATDALGVPLFREDMMVRICLWNTLYHW